MTRAELIQYITDNVYPNARNEVTAPMVRDSLLEIVDFLGDAATYNIGMVASGNQGLVTGGNVNTAIALALLPYYTAQETGQAIDDAIARIGLGQAAYKNIGQVAENNTDLVTGGQVYTAINTALTSAIKFQGISDTPLTDGSTTNPIQINGQSYTAKKGDMVVYGGNEFLWVGNKWQQMGDESSYALKTIQITGTGYLTGGGDLTQSRTLDISATAKGYIDHGEAAYNYFPGGVLDSTHLPSMYIGTTSVQFSAVAQNLTGISSVRATSNVLTLFEWDVTNSAWHFHGNIYTDGWFSGGGISPGGGGGGGGIDPVAMWRLLTNDPSLTQYDDYTKISADHINFPVTSVVGLGGNVTAQQIAQALNLGSYAYKNSLSVSDIPDLSGTYLPKAGGAMTGSISLSDNVAIVWSPTFTNYFRMPFRIIDGTHYTGINLYNSGGQVYTKLGVFTNQYGEGNDGNSIFLYPNDVAKIGTYYIWHAGNLTKSVLTGLLDASGGYYLPLAGGTIDSTSFGALCIKRGASAGNSTSIKFQDGNTISGYLGFQYDDGNYKPGYWDAATNFNYFYHSGNFNPGDYLPLTGGTISKANAVPLYINATGGAQSAIVFSLGGTNASQVGHADNTVGTWLYDYTSSAYINITHTGELRYNNTNPIYHSGNANKSDVAWACSTLDAATSVSAPRFADANNRDVLLSNPAAVNPYMIFGYGNMASGATTYIDGNTIKFRCGTSYKNALTITNDGVVNVQNSSAIWPFKVETDYNANNTISTVWAGYPSGYGLFVGTSANGVGTPIFNVVSGEAGHGTGGTSRFVVRANGTVGVNNANPQYDFDVAGVIHASTGIYTDGWFSGGGVASSSDRRLKKNIKNFAYTPKLLLAIRPREWDWKDGSAMVGHAAGFVAQEIEPIMPYAVDGTRNFKALFYDRFHALEIAGLQDHERRIVELERAVKERDAKIEKLEKMLKLN